MPIEAAQRARLLQELGVDLWVRRDLPGQLHEVASPGRETAGAPASAASGRADPIAQMDWSMLQTAVSGCTRCALHTSRTQTVFGVGDASASWMLVGEAPGAEEDRRGEPFVGRAGQLLNAMLRACGVDREQVFIANILKCRPPRNRDPQADESAQCADYLARQIELVQPAMILALGRVAAQHLLDVDTPLGRLRGRVHTLPASDIPVVVTYHPAYLLRSPADKAKAWADLGLARECAPAVLIETVAG